MSYPGQVQNKPTAAYVLSLLGGIFGLLISIGFLALGAIAYAAYSSAVADYYGYYSYSSAFGWGWATLLGLGVWMLITAILIIVFAGKLKSNPMEHSKWGALILIFSIIGLGGLLGFIGGILALAYKPIPYQGYQQPYPQGYQQPYAQPAQSYPQQAQQQYPQQPQNVQQMPQQQKITRICPQCGRVVDENIRFCPFCGNQLG